MEQGTSYVSDSPTMKISTKIKQGTGYQIKILHVNTKDNCQEEHESIESNEMNTEPQFLTEIFCPKCGLQSSSKCLNKKCSHCKQLPMYRCLQSLCNKEFMNLTYLRSHIEHHHLASRCSKCRKMFKLREQLHNHKMHCGTVDYLYCEFCRYRTKGQNILRAHIVKYHQQHLIAAADVANPFNPM